MVASNAATVTKAVVATTSAATGSIDASPKIDIGGTFTQLEEIMRPYLDTAVGDAWKVFAPGFAQLIVGPTLVSQYADRVMITLEGKTKALPEIDTGVHNKFIGGVINAFTSNEPAVLKWLGQEATAFVPSILSKLGLKL